MMSVYISVHSTLIDKSHHIDIYTKADSNAHNRITVYDLQIIQHCNSVPIGFCGAIMYLCMLLRSYGSVQWGFLY